MILQNLHWLPFQLFVLVHEVHTSFCFSTELWMEIMQTPPIWIELNRYSFIYTEWLWLSVTLWAFWFHCGLPELQLAWEVISVDRQIYQYYNTTPDLLTAIVAYVPPTICLIWIPYNIDEKSSISTIWSVVEVKVIIVDICGAVLTGYLQCKKST